VIYYSKRSHLVYIIGIDELFVASAFHKECILEWLAKNHDECPCCRIVMMTKSEIKEASASLVGTERLAQAMAGSELEPPIRVSTGQRLARQMLARTRAQRRQSEH